ncbi:hypothetical protein QBC44DRAFT_365024 [Cladorrhinum sp. PSN332]|nr:hypothetical protein QBC44DRAFT_365024 [Cladorrhinum sp. PSN332]
MFSAIGLATARRVRFGGALHGSSRLYLNAAPRSAVVIPSGFRLAAAFQRGLAQARAAATKQTTSKTTKATASKTAATASKSKATPTSKASTSKASASKASTSKATASKSTSTKPKAKAASPKKAASAKVKTPSALRREKAAIASKAKKEKAAAAAKAKKEKAAADAKERKLKAAATKKEKKEKAAVEKKERAVIAKEKKKIALANRREKAATIAAKRKERRAIAAQKAKEKKAAAAARMKEKRAIDAARKKERENSPKAQRSRQLQKIRELRKIALLEEIPRAPTTGWSIFTAKNLAAAIEQAKATGGSPLDAFKALSAKYHAMPAEELETLRLQARENYLANEVAYKAWIASHSPVTIREANKARIQLRHLGVKSKSAIHDPRLPKAPSTSFIQYFNERMKSAHYENIPQMKKAASAAAEWRTMNEAARQPYKQAAKLDADRYYREVKAMEESRVAA